MITMMQVCQRVKDQLIISKQFRPEEVEVEIPKLTRNKRIPGAPAVIAGEELGVLKIVTPATSEQVVQEEFDGEPRLLFPTKMTRWSNKLGATFTFNITSEGGLHRHRRNPPPRLRLEYSIDDGMKKHGQWSRKSRIQTKHGFNWEDVAYDVAMHIKREDTFARASVQSKTNEDAVVVALNTELGIAKWGASGIELTGSSETDKPVLVRFSINRAMTVEQTKDLIAKLRELGLVRPPEARE